jgi:hypothetical protein
MRTDGRPVWTRLKTFNTIWQLVLTFSTFSVKNVHISFDSDPATFIIYLKGVVVSKYTGIRYFAILAFINVIGRYLQQTVPNYVWISIQIAHCVSKRFITSELSLSQNKEKGLINV